MEGPLKRSGPEGPLRTVVVPTTTDRERLARERVQAIDRRCRIARMADQLMPMAVWYRQPKGCFYCVVVEGWGAA
jgi:hypothetical protein